MRRREWPHRTANFFQVRGAALFCPGSQARSCWSCSRTASSSAWISSWVRTGTGSSGRRDGMRRIGGTGLGAGGSTGGNAGAGAGLAGAGRMATGTGAQPGGALGLAARRWAPAATSRQTRFQIPLTARSVRGLSFPPTIPAAAISSAMARMGGRCFSRRFDRLAYRCRIHRYAGERPACACSAARVATRLRTGSFTGSVMPGG